MTRHLESSIQQQCVAWFRLQHRSLAKLLFAVPNGGARRLREAQIMKAEGVTAGVSDLILLVARGGYNALCIEMKRESSSSRLSPAQKEWQQLAKAAGNKCVVCRSLDDFQREITTYLFASRPANESL